MAGHSKWAQIKRQKAVTDAAKSRVFSRFAKEIAMESKKAQGNVSAPGLASVITRAKEANMPKENIERAVAKGISKDGGELDRAVYECFVYGGVALIISAVTDSKNRTTQELKHLLSKNGIELSVPGSASWAFTKHADGSFTAHEPLVDLSQDDEEKIQTLLSLLDEYPDTQELFTNARGYERTGADEYA